MALKRAKFYSYGSDNVCAEIRQFIEDAGVILEVRDLEKEPLTLIELHRMIGYIGMDHFYNANGSKSKVKFENEQAFFDIAICTNHF